MSKILSRWLMPLSFLVLVFVNQANASQADLVISNARIYTLNPAQPWAEAVAVKDGNIVYVGDSRKALSMAGPDSRTLDLQGAMLMPGLNDAHVHPTTGAVKALFECNFPYSVGPKELALAVQQCANIPEAPEWVRGGQWSSDFFINNTLAVPRKFLDKVSGDKAVVLVDDAYHNAWFNTKALKLLGLFNKDATIEGGSLEKNPADGLPNGIAVEAFGFLQKNLPWNREQYQQAAAYAIHAANQQGITGIKGTAMTEPELQGYQDYAEQNGPSIHMAAALMTPYGHRQEPLNLDSLKATRQRYQGSFVDASFAKIFMDGVPTAARTAAMLAPYTQLNEGDPDNYGTLHLAPKLLQQDVIALDKEGFTVKIHTAGDRSVRVALDAIAAARKANGNSGLRHELAHAGYISDVDFPRFKQLNAVADLCPFIWSPSPIIDSVVAAVGEPRGSQYWPIKSLLESGTSVLVGSDWPAAVPTINPWPGLESMISRKDPGGIYPGTLWAEQAIRLDQALRVFTLDSARALKKSTRTGSIEVGKSADFIRLNHNLFDIEVEDISETRVISTWFAGREVYSAK